MKAVITVVGLDRVGILANVASRCAEVQANVLDVSQTILDSIFTMTMIVDMSQASCSVADLGEQLASWGQEQGLSIRVMHEAIFQAMHRV